MAGSPTVRRRRLAAELRQLRQAADMTIEEVAARLNWQPSKISRIETRKIGINTLDLRNCSICMKLRSVCGARL